MTIIYISDENRYINNNNMVNNQPVQEAIDTSREWQRQQPAGT